MAEYIEFTDQAPTTTELEEKYGMFVEQMYLSFDRRSAYFRFTEAEQEAQDYMKKAENVRAFDPILAFNVEEKELNTEILPELEKAALEFATKYVLGTETGDSAWENWKEKAKKLGADKLTDNYNSAQKRISK